MDVRRVRSWSQLWQFLRLPHRVYSRNNSLWVPPLRLHILLLMGSLKATDRVFYLAYRDGKPVARAGFKIHKVNGQEALHFGFFEAQPDCHAEVQALIEAGHQLAPHLPMRGPHHFRLEDPYPGLLVDGFDSEPYFMMAHNPPYYAELLEEAGLVKAQDLFTYRYRPEHVRLNIMKSRASRAAAKGITIETMQPGRLVEQVREMAEIFNDALSANWGFEPIEGKQLEDMILEARFILDPDKVLFARQDGRTIGACLIVPNLNPALKASGGGVNLTLLWKYLTRHRWVDSYRGYALGVRKEYRADEIASALIHYVMERAQTTRWRELEVSWVLESNRPMLAMAAALGGQKTKTYRVLERPALQ